MTESPKRICCTTCGKLLAIRNGLGTIEVRYKGLELLAEEISSLTCPRCGGKSSIGKKGIAKETREVRS